MNFLSEIRNPHHSEPKLRHVRLFHTVMERIPTDVTARTLSHSAHCCGRTAPVITWLTGLKLTVSTPCSKATASAIINIGTQVGELLPSHLGRFIPGKASLYPFSTRLGGGGRDGLDGLEKRKVSYRYRVSNPVVTQLPAARLTLWTVPMNTLAGRRERNVGKYASGGDVEGYNTWRVFPRSRYMQLLLHDSFSTRKCMWINTNMLLNRFHCLTLFTHTTFRKRLPPSGAQCVFTTTRVFH
jgi:hypothetical protein